MSKTPKSSSTDEEKKVCGIIMPISGSDSYTEKHWSDVKAIINTAIKNAGFEPKMVSEADEIGIIHNRIVTNIAENPIIVCDVSSKNPNVMFELGLRLAFDKPTIIIKDDITSYNFDTSPIEHITYRKDLRQAETNDFISSLEGRIISTFDKSVKDPNYSPFLKSFIQYKVALKEEEVGLSELFTKRIDSLENMIISIANSNRQNEDSILSNNFNLLMSEIHTEWHAFKQHLHKDNSPTIMYNGFTSYLKKDRQRGLFEFVENNEDAQGLIARWARSYHKSLNSEAHAQKR